MIKFHRVWAIVLRHLRLTFRSLERVLNIFYWPFLNIVLWGITSRWLQQQTNDVNILAMVLTGLIFWQIVFRVNIEAAKSLFEELTNHNLVNLFSTPLTLSEWIAAVMLLGAMNMVLIMIFGILIAYLLYGVNILTLGWTIIPFACLLLMSGWFIGIFICGFLIYWGQKAQDLIYSIGWIFAPFSAIYYPLSALPYGIQIIGKFLPTTYVFENMRQVIQTGVISPSYVFISFLLNSFYCLLAVIFFKHMFEKSKEKSLARLE